MKSHALRTLPNTLKRILAAATCACVLAAPGSALADETKQSPYCRRVKARASSDAALLFAPSVHVQGIKFPTSGAIDSLVTVGDGYQARGGVSWSPLEFYKGFQVLSVGEADCKQHEATVSAYEVLSVGADYGRLPALRKQAAFLDSRRDRWTAIVAKTEERLDAKLTSVLDESDVRARTAELERRRVQLGGEISRLESKHVDVYRGMLSSLVLSVDATTMQFEREAAHVRSLDAWNFRLTGGMTPHERADFYGLVEISFNLGSFSRNAADTRYVDARQDEIRKARYEVRDQVARFHQQLASVSGQTKKELEIVERQAARVSKVRETLSGSEAPNAPHALAVIDLEAIFLESERVYLTALLEELARLEDKGNGH